MGHSPPMLHPIRLLLHQWGRFISNSFGSPNDSCYHPQFRNDGFSWKSALPSWSWIVSRNISFSFSWEVSEGEELRISADLHSGGDKSNDLVVLEYEEIRQQMKFGTTCMIFNGNAKSISVRFSVGLLRALWGRGIVYGPGLIETWKPLVVSCSECACECGPKFVVWCTSSWYDDDWLHLI